MNLLQPFLSDSRVEIIVKTISQNKDILEMALHSNSADNMALAAITQKIGGRHLLVMADREKAEQLISDLKVLHFPIPFQLLEPSFELKKNAGIIHSYRVSNRRVALDEWKKNQNFLLVSYPEALIEKISVNNRAVKTFKKGDHIHLPHWIDFCDKLGFERVPYVYDYGQYSIRGNIIDIYSYSHPLPIRLELFDTEIEDIRSFEVESQLSVADVPNLILSGNAASEMDNELMSIFKFLPTDAKLWVTQPKEMLKIAQQTIEFLEENAIDDEREKWSKNTLVGKKELKADLEKVPHIVLFPIKSTQKWEGLSIGEIEDAPDFNKNFNKLAQTIDEYTKKGYEVVLMCEEEKQFERFKSIFSDLSISINYSSYLGELVNGFIDHFHKKVYLTTHQIFQRQKRNIAAKPNQNSAQAILLKNLKELVPGDYVVHIDHGVGQFSGLEKLEVNGHFQEAVRLIYQNNDILYVHINSLYKISKFVGKEGQAPRLNKIGSDSWQAIKRKTKRQIKDIAESLIKLYAQRKASKGHAFSPDTYMQYELEESFEYEDTPDQTSAIQAIKADMERDIPMDRLVCGDVGFGKTEVAIRAAFKAVADSKQVAVLVPTTILALQHYRTFSRRLKDFPCNIDFINRFKTTKQKNEIYKKLEKGQIDILIGTHAIVSKNVKFKDLGLLIIDEEQKFGVGVKEKLKEMKLNVDTLTLSATPIPRTLQFSLLGARDYSLIQTPPPNRIPVYTEICQFEPNLIKEIIENEVHRGGQVFFINNRIKELEQLMNTLRSLMPNIAMVMAHGQLPSDKLEEIIVDFMDTKYDVLFSTNIIESGIDIPNANTIIIHNAHQFGMSDLYQMRGRVGRSNKKAYCYLICPNIHSLTSDAKQRLRAIEQNSDLGSGFQIAMRDLDLRGAGNLLGGEQSGFISDIGYDTYIKILDEAISELKENKYSELYETDIDQTIYAKDCAIETDQDLYIPDAYIPQSQERMSIYQEINALKNEESLQKFMSGLKDRFGKWPKPMLELANAIRLKWVATRLGIERIKIKSGKMKCYLIQNSESKFYQSTQFAHLIEYITKNPRGKNLKQSSQYLILEITDVNNCSEAKEQLEAILQH